MAYALALSAPTGIAVSVASAIGGSGGGGGNGGKVSFTNAGAITTYANDATGVLAQSIGGWRRQWRRSAAAANAISLRSGLMYDQSIGGSGGHGGHGGDVSITSAVDGGGTIRTYGDNAVAILGQSIGGGGGNGGSVNSAAATNLGVGKGLSTLAQMLMLGNSFTGSLSLGGTGGDGGNGGHVDIHTGQSSLLLTTGAHSSGIFANPSAAVGAPAAAARRKPRGPSL